jgi:outer membrane biosynthesis protein TonB
VANGYDTCKALPSLAPPLELRKSKHAGRMANLQMNFGRQFGTLVLASVLLFGLGCEKKKPQLPAQAKAPVETVSPPLPSEISEEVPPPPPPAPNPTPPSQPTASVAPPKHRPKKKVTTPAPSTQAAANPPATTPSTSTGTIAMLRSQRLIHLRTRRRRLHQIRRLPPM